MNRKYAIYVGLIALLAGVNLWRWGAFSSQGDKNNALHSKVFVAEDFRLHVDSSAIGAPSRDLFNSGKGSLSATARLQPRPVVAKAPVQTPPLPEQAAAEAAGAELGKLKLLGVVFRAGKGQAYLAFDKENVIALSGDTVLGRFAVAKIGVDAVDLRDLKTNASRRIPVSGK